MFPTFPIQETRPTPLHRKKSNLKFWPFNPLPYPGNRDFKIGLCSLHAHTPSTAKKSQFYRLTCGFFECIPGSGATCATHVAISPWFGRIAPWGISIQTAHFKPSPAARDTCANASPRRPPNACLVGQTQGTSRLHHASHANVHGWLVGATL